MTKKYILAGLFTVLIPLFQACEKDLDLDQSIEPYLFATLDENGGNWTPILLSSGAEIALPAAQAINSPEYLAERQALKATSANLSPEQQKAVDYWGANALVRWNEIARDLVAKYNLPPAANPDGTYPVPNPVNPGVYPLFPFSNPPYASRTYAYWGAAQFDALVAAWYHKYQNNRPAPYQTDNSIATHLPKNNLPSYPSEDAVIAAVSESILSAMFPLEANFLKEKAEEHRNSRLWAGMNTGSDLAAGDALGKAVAQKFLDRSKTDGMKNANGTASIQDSLRNSAQTRFGWHWNSLESPGRPGMLCQFGRVKAWCIPNVESLRPAPPPAPGSPEFQAAVRELEQLSGKLSTTQRRIANEWADGVSTYTPPGHWNRIAAELILAGQINPLRTARCFAYLNMSIMDAGISCWDTKYFYHYPRPSQLIPGYRSVLGLPNFPSYSSGHSTFSAAAASVLSHIFPNKAAELEQMAIEASESRIYGGIHFRFDCEAGLQAGKNIAAYSLAVAAVDGAE